MDRHLRRRARTARRHGGVPWVGQGPAHPTRTPRRPASGRRRDTPRTRSSEEETAESLALVRPAPLRYPWRPPRCGRSPWTRGCYLASSCAMSRVPRRHVAGPARGPTTRLADDAPRCRPGPGIRPRATPARAARRCRRRTSPQPPSGGTHSPTARRSTTQRTHPPGGPVACSQCDHLLPQVGATWGLLEPVPVISCGVIAGETGTASGG